MTNLSLKKSITINAKASKVWDALTNPELIKKYLFGTQTISDWTIGSQIKFVGEWEGKKYEDKGTILKFDKEKILRYSYWSSFSGKPDTPENYLIVTFELEKKGKSVVLTLTNENFADEKSLEHSKKNWGMVLKGLKKTVEFKE